LNDLQDPTLAEERLSIGQRLYELNITFGKLGRNNLDYLISFLLNLLNRWISFVHEWELVLITLFIHLETTSSLPPVKHSDITWTTFPFVIFSSFLIVFNSLVTDLYAYVQQNTNGVTHSCGFCSFGCPFGEKQGGTATWLTDAADHGTKFIQQVSVTRLLFAESSASPSPTKATLASYTPSSSRRKCIGALLKDNKSGKFSIVRAKEAVVVSGGSINSPAILLRSGLKGSRIGKNLHLHPVTYITGYYAEVINPWEGSIMTAVRCRFTLPTYRLILTIVRCWSKL
jgi:hypothetical protein